MEQKTKAIVVETRKRTRPEGWVPPVIEIGPKFSPCGTQTEADIEAYYRHAEKGTVAVVRETQGHILRYTVTEVEGTNPSAGRTYIKNHGAFYMKHGKNCFHPKGQTTLVVPNDEILAWAKERPHGETGWWCHAPETYPFKSAGLDPDKYLKPKVG